MNFVKVPPRFIVYLSEDKDDAQPYTVVYPDGAVFLFEDTEKPTASYLCQFASFTPRNEDKIIKSVPKNILDKLLKMEA